ncbi:MAG TPA: type I restriction-modification system subunit M N-terminal domain-containing protein [Armatimonadota bacterium]
MPRSSPKTAKSKKNGGQPDLKATLWAAADKMRGKMNPSEYKHAVLGLIFLKYVSDRFEAHLETLRAKVAAPASDYYSKGRADLEGVLEDRDEYTAENVFWVPRGARWGVIQSGAKLPTVGQAVDDAMVAIEKENASLKGVLPKQYGSSALDKRLLGELINLIGTIGFRGREDVFDGEGEQRQEHRPGVVLAPVNEYLLWLYASAKWRLDGEFVHLSVAIWGTGVASAHAEPTRFSTACTRGRKLVLWLPPALQRLRKLTRLAASGPHADSRHCESRGCCIQCGVGLLRHLRRSPSWHDRYGCWLCQSFAASSRVRASISI